MNPALIAKVLVTKQNGNRIIGTAYPINENWIITAYHVVCFNERDKNIPIQIKWQETEPIKVTEERFIKCTNNDGIALLQCKVPQQWLEKLPILATQAPNRDKKWDSLGYPRFGQENKQRTKQPAKGEFFIQDEDNPCIQLSSIGDAKEKEDWAGMSGAPIFQDNILYAINISTPTQVNERFIAISIPWILKNKADYFTNINIQSIACTSPPQKIEISKLPATNNPLFGRETELVLLDQAWNNQTRIVSLIAMGGSGKTALMQHWLERLSEKNYAGAEKIYAWSFYSQGAAEDKQASADEFFNDALKWFDNQDKTLKTSRDKALKLAELIKQQKTLLILDGLEPLQYPVNAKMDGILKDNGLLTLITELSLYNQGLLLLSSRQVITELNHKSENLVIQHKLASLTVEAGTALFKAVKIQGTEQEFSDAVNEVDGHALSLNLLSQYISQYAGGDIRQRRNLPALTASPEVTASTRHAFKVMAAYESQLKDTTELQILYLIGLFDRPASEDAIAVLRRMDIIELFDKISNDQIFKACCCRLREQNLLNKMQAENPHSLDAHPLIREYFSERLQNEYPEAWQKAHLVLYNYYKDLPEKDLPDTLDEMVPLFAAVRHGCLAGLHQEVFDEIYQKRIRHTHKFYLTKSLGSIGLDLAILSNFFKQKTNLTWSEPIDNLKEKNKALILNITSSNLRSLGRLQESTIPLKKGLDITIKNKEWKNAAIDTINLNNLQLLFGWLREALIITEQSITFSKLSKNYFIQTISQVNLAQTQHQIGHINIALRNFIEAEKLQKQDQPKAPILYGMSGFEYCDLLLDQALWIEVQKRAEQTLLWAKLNKILLDIALDQLSLGRANLQQNIEHLFKNNQQLKRKVEQTTTLATKIADLNNIKAIPQNKFKTNLFNYLAPELVVLIPSLPINFKINQNQFKYFNKTKNRLNQSVNGFVKAERDDYLPKGLLARANYYRWRIFITLSNPINQTQQSTNFLNKALHDLNEAHFIAKRSSMRLHLTDIYLEKARLSLTLQQPIDNQPPEFYLKKAEQLIIETGYYRRLAELWYCQAVLETIKKDQ